MDIGRICNGCGKFIYDGFTDDHIHHAFCEDCFIKDMNERYGEGNWRSAEEENEEGGYYEYFQDGEWLPEPSYWTMWF